MAEQFLASLLSRVKTGKRFYSANAMIEDIRTNVETILNSRLMIPANYLLRSTSNRFDETLDNSLVNFGIADIQSLNLGDELMEQRFCESVRLAVERFETRLTQVSIEMVPSIGDRIINIVVRGGLAVAPYEDIQFQSGVEPELQKFVVS